LTLSHNARSAYFPLISQSFENFPELTPVGILFPFLMKSSLFVLVSLASTLGAPLLGTGQIYSGPVDTAHVIDPAIAASDSRLTLWAGSVVNYNPAPGVSMAYADPTNALGPYNTSIVSLGDLSAQQIIDGLEPGSITLRFDTPFRNTVGFDFAVFENGFTYGSPNGLFAELAFVEVSSNGVDFARFAGISTNLEPVTGSGAFAGYDMSTVYHLAGKHAGGYGTPFELDTLSNHSLVLSGLLNLDSIAFVRLIDIPGNGSYLDSLGHPILDNWQTTGSGGFDLRGIGAVSAVPEPAVVGLFMAAGSLFAVIVRRRRQN